MATFSQAFLEWEQTTREQGLQQGLQQGATQEARLLIYRLLTRRLGNLPDNLRTQVEALPLAQLENLGEALLDFSELADLQNWLFTQSPGDS